MEKLHSEALQAKEQELNGRINQAVVGADGCGCSFLFFHTTAWKKDGKYAYFFFLIWQSQFEWVVVNSFSIQPI